MPTKRELADRAFDRQEDQRALATILGVAESKVHDLEDDDDQYHYRAELEAAIERVKARLVITPPTVKAEPSVPGQINLLDGSIETCPQCGAPRWRWVALAHEAEVGEEPRLQCGNCALVVVTTWTQYNAIVAERRRQHSHTDTVKPDTRIIESKQGRGAR